MTADEGTGRQAEEQRADNVVPTLLGGADLSRLRLDDLTERLLRAVDGAKSAAEIAEELDASDPEILSRLTALRQVGAVELASVEPSAKPRSRLTVMIDGAAQPPTDTGSAGRQKAGWRDAHLTVEENRFIDANLSRYLVVDLDAGRPLAGLGLTQKEARYVKNVAAKPMQLREALSISNLYRSLTRKLMFQLIDRRVFKIHETNPEGTAPVPLSELIPYLKRIERENHFDVLTAHATSTREEIEARYRQRLAQFDPSLYPRALEVHLDALEGIRARMTAAWEVLGDPRKRHEHRAAVYDRDQLAMFFDLQLRKTEMALRMRRDPATAIQLAESALEIRPSSPEARLLLATALAELGRVQEARRHLGMIAAAPQAIQAELAELKRRLGG